MRGLLVVALSLAWLLRPGFTAAQTASPAFALGTQYTLTQAGSKGLGELTALSGDGQVALVGSSNAAALYREPLAGWASTGTPAALLSLPSNGVPFDLAISADGTAALVSTQPGSVYLYVEPSGGWSGTVQPTTTLLCTADTAQSLALDGDGRVALVTNEIARTACLFTEPAGGWAAQNPVRAASELTPGTPLGGGDGADIAAALNRDGTVALVGEAIGNTIGNIYEAKNGKWTSLSYPAASLVLNDARVGEGVALSGRGLTAMVGTPATAVHPAGQVHIFGASGGGWSGNVSPMAELTQPAGADDLFGSQISLSGDGEILLAGSSSGSTVDQGYLFREPSTGWDSTATADQILTSPSGSPLQTLALSADGTTTLAGDANAGNGAGAAYVQGTSAPLMVDSAQGSDSNPCTSDKPCQSLHGALQRARLQDLDGVTILLAAKTVSGSSGGLYCEQVQIGTSVQVRSTFPRLSLPATIDGGGPGTYCPATAGDTPAGPVLTVMGDSYLSLVRLNVVHGIGVASNSIQAGGGILNDGGTLYITAVSVSDNTVTGMNGAGGSCSGGQAEAGGILNENGGEMTLLNVTVQGNTVSGGSAASGGSCDAGIGLGGGILNGGQSTLTLYGSSITDNTVAGGKSGGTLGGGAAFGGGIENLGALTLNGSTVSSNQALGGAGAGSGSGGNGSGGGLDNGSIATGATALAINTTVAGNTAVGGSGSTGSGGGTGQGGGIAVSSGTFIALQDTVALNSAGTGGGIFDNGSSSGPSAAIGNTLLARNTASSAGPDCSGNVQGVNFEAPDFLVVGHNLLGDNAGCSFADKDSYNVSGPGDQVGSAAAPIDPKLDPNGLQSNGGPTQTIALTTGDANPAVGAAAGLACLAWTGGADQRGIARQVATRSTCDVGAYDTGESVHLQLSGPSTMAAAVDAPFTMTAFNAAEGTHAIGYEGTVQITSSDLGATGPDGTPLPLTASVGHSELGTHEFDVVFGDVSNQSVRVTDGGGLTGTAGVLVGVSIYKGWNFIDLPLQGMGISDAAGLIACLDGNGSSPCVSARPQLGAGAIRELAVFANGRFQMYLPGYSPDLSLAATQGVFVYSMVDGVWLPGGSAYTTLPSVPLQPGWNVIALPSSTGGLTTTTIAGDAPKCHVQEIAWYRYSVLQTWRPGQAAQTVPGYEGAWILCQSSDTLHP